MWKNSICLTTTTVGSLKLFEKEVVLNRYSRKDIQSQLNGANTQPCYPPELKSWGTIV